MGDYRGCHVARASHGTAAGISLHQNLHRGFTGTAGEIGHVQVDARGQVCLCGSRGCLNTVVGAPPSSKSTERLTGDPEPPSSP